MGDKALDGRSDIYAIGCLGYWLVTGQLVFSGHTVMETLLQHTHAAPIPPSQRTELAVPDTFDQLIMACLAKNPEDRPATADALAGRLATIEMGSDWTPERARQWWDVHHPAQLKVSAASDLRTY